MGVMEDLVYREEAKKLLENAAIEIQVRINNEWRAVDFSSPFLREKPLTVMRLKSLINILKECQDRRIDVHTVSLSVDTVCVHFQNILIPINELALNFWVLKEKCPPHYPEFFFEETES